jgi:hypothetical protein
MTVNSARAQEGRAALQTYQLEAADTDLAGNDGEQHAFVYLLAALRHLCDAQGWDFAALDSEGHKAYRGDIDAN